MKLLTYATKDAGYYAALLTSARKAGLDVHVLGFGHEWRGFLQRSTALLEHLHTLDDDEVVAVVDAYDVLVLGSAKECDAKYRALGTRAVLMGAYHSNAITRSLFGDSDNGDHFYDNISMGCYMGYVASVRTLLSKFCSRVNCGTDLKRNDQRLMTDFYIKECRDCILPDHQCDVFYEIDFTEGVLGGYLQTMMSGTQRERPLSSNLYKWDPVAKRITVARTQGVPVFLHGNGNANLDAFVRELRLPPANLDHRNYFQYSTINYLKTMGVQALLILIFVLHMLFVYMMYVHVYITKSSKLLNVIIVLNAAILWQWYVFGNCIITPLENMLLGSATYADGRDKSIIATNLNKLVGNERVTFIILTFLPIISTVVALVRLNRMWSERNVITSCA